MILGIDHVVIAVRDLAAGARALEENLGLLVTPGGIHPGRGTANAIARFGLDYLELITIQNLAEAESQNRGKVLASYLRRGEGLAGFAAATDHIDAEIAAAWADTVPTGGPFPGERRQPDGSVLRWQTAEVAGDPWGRRLPFLIQHETPSRERESWAPPQGHLLGVIGIWGVTICTPLIFDAMDAFRRYLHVEPDAIGQTHGLFRLGSSIVELIAPELAAAEWPAPAEPVQEGLYGVTLAVPDLRRAAAWLERAGVPYAETARGRILLMDPSRTCNVRFRLAAAR